MVGGSTVERIAIPVNLNMYLALMFQSREISQNWISESFRVLNTVCWLFLDGSKLSASRLADLNFTKLQSLDALGFCVYISLHGKICR